MDESKHTTHARMNFKPKISFSQQVQDAEKGEKCNKDPKEDESRDINKIMKDLSLRNSRARLSSNGNLLPDERILANARRAAAE